MRNLLALIAAVALFGCAGPQPVVKIEHIVVAPDDNLLVDCDIEAPPAKDQYLQDYTIGATAPSIKLARNDDFYLGQYARALKNAEGREAVLTKVLMKNYSNQDVCNRRWKALRTWKAASIKAVSTDKTIGSK